MDDSRSFHVDIGKFKITDNHMYAPQSTSDLDEIEELQTQRKNSELNKNADPRNLSMNFITCDELF